jgi:hypothetical protein
MHIQIIIKNKITFCEKRKKKERKREKPENKITSAKSRD